MIELNEADIARIKSMKGLNDLLIEYREVIKSTPTDDLPLMLHMVKSQKCIIEAEMLKREKK